MGETGRDPHLQVVLGRQYRGYPLAKGGRTAAQVDGDIVDFAGHDAHQLALHVSHLVVQAAQHALAGSRVVILHEGRRKTGLSKIFEPGKFP